MPDPFWDMPRETVLLRLLGSILGAVDHDERYAHRVSQRDMRDLRELLWTKLGYDAVVAWEPKQESRHA